MDCNKTDDLAVTDSAQKTVFNATMSPDKARPTAATEL